MYSVNASKHHSIHSLGCSSCSGDSYTAGGFAGTPAGSTRLSFLESREP
jgi:hypothetical protein